MTTASPTLAAFPKEDPSNGMGWRVAVSIVTVFGLASFLLLFAAFWAGPFTIFQVVAVCLVAALVFIAINGAAWASWGVARRTA